MQFVPMIVSEKRPADIFTIALPRNLDSERNDPVRIR